MIEYSIVCVEFDEGEYRLDKIFKTEKQAKEYAKKNVFESDWLGYRIMKMEYHIENNEKIYDDEICVYSWEWEEEQ